MLRSAHITEDGVYRLWLSRMWVEGGQRCVFIGLNPSMADGFTDDPTVRRCVDFAQRWGFGSLMIVNLYAFRATDPRELWKVEDSVGPHNDLAIFEVCRNADLTVCAWGTKARPGRVAHVLELINRPHVLRLAKSGEPCHPLYLPKSLVPVPWDVKGAIVDG